MSISHNIRKILDRICQEKSITNDELTYLRLNANTNLPEETHLDLLSCFKFIGNPDNAMFVDPYLRIQNPELASQAIWTLCWLGLAVQYKPYILEAVEPGFSWDKRRKISSSALGGAGLHLNTHRDRDFAQLILRWALREDDDDFYYDDAATDRSAHIWRSTGHSARIAAGYAMGADPFELTENEELVAGCVARFAAERQEG